MKQKWAHWRRLDNAAKLFSAASNKQNTRVFRFYCELKEEVQPDLLQQALDASLETYPLFLSVLRKGLFWQYLEKSELHPVVRKEYREPCGCLYFRDRLALLFEVTYYKKRINFEVFHVLTDGTGATAFLKELVKNYLYLAHREEGLEAVSLLPEDLTVQDQEMDSFSKYYSKASRHPKRKKPRAYQLKKQHKENGRLRVHEKVLSVREVLGRSRELGVSMTVFLTAALLCAIHEEMSRQQENRPVVLMVPVNLRKFFPSESMLNFFHWIEPGYHFQTGVGTFADVLEQVRQYFTQELTKEKMEAHMSELIDLEVNPLLRLAPLELKNLCIHAGAKIAEKNVTAVFSNMSAVVLPEDYAAYIERFGIYTSTPKMELCICSFEDKLSLGFTSRFDTENIQRNFYRILKEQGVHAEQIVPDFPEPEVPGEVEMKVYKGFTMLCLALVVVMFALDHNHRPEVPWTLFTAGGIFSMWLASTIGFFKRRNLLKNAVWQMFIVTVGCIIWDVLTGWHGWSVDLVLPVICTAICLSLVVISRIQHYRAGEYLIYFVIAAGYGCLLPVILVIAGAVTWELPSLLGAGFCFLFLVGLVLFKGREFQEEMRKKFHI